MNRIPIIARILLLSVFVLVCSVQAFPQTPQKTDDKKETVRLKLSDGTYLTVDDAWETPQGVWYKQQGISHLLSKDRVKKIERTSPSETEEETDQEPLVASTPTPPPQNGVYDKPAWIYLKGGARFEADSATESPAGVWYKRGPLAIFIDRSRVEKVELVESIADSSGTKERAWTTGRPGLDSLIRQNGHKHGVDPYLIFLVMEQESHFNPRALSPKGARGLMQLMPGTAARFGVRRPHDPAQNISGGTRYLRELLNRFNNRVDLVLASYNAGEGAVIRFGHRVPPYRETRNYVKKISYRYKSKTARTKKGATPPASPAATTGGR